MSKSKHPRGSGIEWALLLWALFLWGCHGSTQARKGDASVDGLGRIDGRTDAWDGLAAFTEADAEAPDSPPGVADVETKAEDAAIFGSVADASAAKSDSPGQPETAVEATTKPDRPADSTDAREDGSAPPSQTDSAPTLIDAFGPDAAERDANSGTPSMFRLTVVPNRMIDLVFVIDNSPSMSQKQAKLRAQFPRLIDALKDPIDGTLPDLRLALVDSDLGTGGAYPDYSTCGRNTSNNFSPYGDQGKFQMKGAADCGVTIPDSQWLEYWRGQPINFAGDISTVFSCLASNLGTSGCGQEHQLQAFEFALVIPGIGNEAQHAMLRPSAYLGLVFLSDEEDCSAATNDGMFGVAPGGTDLSAESASLRCATRAHACSGVNLSQTVPGYPTTQGFSALLSTCQARTDACPNPTDGTSSTDTSLPTACSPLKGIKRIADEMKALKRRPDEQILVAGIFGWPREEENLPYRIDLVPNPSYQPGTTAKPQFYDSWPICYDPGHLPTSPDPATGFDATAASWGATPGLRLSAFVDEFGDNGLKFSICQPDYSAAMLKIGATMRKKSVNLCVPYRADDYRTCTANFLVPDGDGQLVRDPNPVPRCSLSSFDEHCFTLTPDTARCAGSQLEIQILPNPGVDIDGGSPLPTGTMMELTCS